MVDLAYTNFKDENPPPVKMIIQKGNIGKGHNTTAANVAAGEHVESLFKTLQNGEGVIITAGGIEDAKKPSWLRPGNTQGMRKDTSFNAVYCIPYPNIIVVPVL